jgi:Putative peptidoglycan binding domain/D-alanyl-D-alanine carboxypeptidase
MAAPAGADGGDEALQPIEPPPDYEFLDPEPDEPAPPGGTPRGEVTAEGRGWGRGWPADNAGSMTVVRAGGIALSVRREIGPLVAFLVDETVKEGYGLRTGECWGFANRPIRGTQRPSNHSWGLAVDLNSLSNPMGDRLVTDIPGHVVKRWTDLTFRWGGAYNGRKDAMHFEFMGTPDEAAWIIAHLPGAPVSPPAPGVLAQPKVRKGDTGEAVKQLQLHLNRHGAQLVVDGDFGAKTDAAVRAFQQANGLEVDGIVGDKTWAALAR